MYKLLLRTANSSAPLACASACISASAQRCVVCDVVFVVAILSSDSLVGLRLRNDIRAMDD